MGFSTSQAASVLGRSFPSQREPQSSQTRDHTTGSSLPTSCRKSGVTEPEKGGTREPPEVLATHEDGTGSGQPRGSGRNLPRSMQNR